MPAPTPALANAVILVVHPGAELYGSDRVVLESVVALLEQNARVVVALPAGGPLVELLHSAGAEVELVDTLVLRKDYLRLRRLPALIWKTMHGSLTAARLLRRLRPDTVYVNTVTLPLWPPIARLLGIPVITHVHEGERSSPRMLRALLYLPHLASTTVLFNSEFSRTVVASVYPRLAQRGITIYNGVEGPDLAVEPRKSLQGQLRVLYIGRLSPRKGPDVLLDAAAILARGGCDIRVGLLGSVFPGYEWYEEQLHTMVRDGQLADNVYFHGFQNEIWPYLAAADVLVVPSRLDEPFGNTAVESALAARPAVVSDTSGLREATADFPSAALVHPGDAEALAQALTRVTDEWSSLRVEAMIDAEAARFRFSPKHYRAEVVREVQRSIRSRSHRSVSAIVPRIGSLSRP